MFEVGRCWTDGQYFAFMPVSTLIFVPVMSCFNMPWVSLGAEMTPDYHERTTVKSVKNANQKLPELGLFFAAQFTTLTMFNDTHGKPDILRGAQAYCSILGAISQRREGSFVACQSWITKVGMALGAGSPGWILQFTGFNSKLPAQSEHAIFMIRILLTGIPVLGFFIALLVVLRYPLTEQRMHEIRARLEARRGMV